MAWHQLQKSHSPFLLPSSFSPCLFQGPFYPPAMTPAEGWGSSLPAPGWKGHSDTLSLHDPHCLEPKWCSISLGLHLFAVCQSTWCYRGNAKQRTPGLRSLPDFMPGIVTSQPPVSIKRMYLEFVSFSLTSLPTLSFLRVLCYLTNDRSLQHPARCWQWIVSLFVKWSKISLCPDLEFLQPLNFIAQQSIQLPLWEGLRPLKFIWWVSRGTHKLLSH